MSHRLSIKNGPVPDAKKPGSTPSLGTQSAADLSCEGRAVECCNGVLGRTGAVASMLLIETTVLRTMSMKIINFAQLCLCGGSCRSGGNDIELAHHRAPVAGSCDDALTYP